MHETLKDKVIYWVDELSIFLVVIMAVIFADALVKRSQGHPAALADVFIDPLNLILSAVIGTIVYGSMVQSWKVRADKPPWPKRAASAILQGIAWRTLVGSVKG
jgi:hypothetical protein